MGYSRARGNHPPKPEYHCPGGRTKQEDKDSCDINRIMQRYEKTGIIPQDVRPVVYANVSDFSEYRDVVDHVQAVESLFMQQPAALRSRFENDAARFLDFCADPDNRSEMIELGLLPQDEEVRESPPEAVPTDEAAGGASE